MAYLKHSFFVGEAKFMQTCEFAIERGNLHLSPAAPTTISISLQSYLTKSILSKTQLDAFSLYLSIVCLIITLSLSNFSSTSSTVCIALTGSPLSFLNSLVILMCGSDNLYKVH